MTKTKIAAVLLFSILLMPGCLSIEGTGTEIIEGCTDEDALNFDENANTNDRSCEYEVVETFEGCTSPSAVNFDPEALINDGSCVFAASGPQIDSALMGISDALNSYKNGEEMDYPLILTGEYLTTTEYVEKTMEVFSDVDGPRMLMTIGGDLIYSATERGGVATVCHHQSEIDCFQSRNYADDSLPEFDIIDMTMLRMGFEMEFDVGDHVPPWQLYVDLLGLEIPPGSEWDVAMADSGSPYQTATVSAPGGTFLTATLTAGSASLVSLSAAMDWTDYTLSLAEGASNSPSEADNPTRLPATIEWMDPETTETGPVYIQVWECYIEMVNLDSLDDDSVESVNEVLYGGVELPDFCGQLVDEDPENGSFTSSGPLFDTRWGIVTYIEDPQTGDWKEVVVEIDVGSSSFTYYLLDVTSEECSHNGGTYDVLTQTCEWITEDSDNTASDLYYCSESEDWGDSCDRYGLNSDGHLVTAYPYTEQTGGGDGTDEGEESIWDCRDSFFAEDSTPLGPDSNDDVQEEVDAMPEPEWCGDVIEWNGTFDPVPSSESALSSNKWNNPDGFYLDFTSAGALNFGDREATQSDCSEYGGTWNTVEEACEFPNGEWAANETLIEIDFGWGMIERIRYEMVDGGVVLAFPYENGSDEGTPNMENTFDEGYEETGYEEYEFVASEDGRHIINSSQTDDGYLYLYETSFNPDTPGQNAIASQDDWEVGGGDWGSSIHWDLESGTTYVIVTTTYSSGEQLSFDNSIISPSGDRTAWSGEIDSQSPTFVRPDGWWEEGGPDPSDESGISILTEVHEWHWNEVDMGELTLEIYSEDGSLIGSMGMATTTMTFEDGTSVTVFDNDGDGLLSAGDSVVMQTNAHTDLYFLVWDEWASDYS